MGSAKEADADERATWQPIKRQIETHVARLFNARGFARRRGRCFYRHFDNRVEVIELRFLRALGRRVEKSMGKGEADFDLPAGVFFTRVPDYSLHGLVEKDGRLLPTEPECHVRFSPIVPFGHFGRPRHHWHVAKGQESVSQALGEIEEVLDTSLQTFFDQFSNEEKAIDFIGHHPDPGPDKGPWGYGPKDGMSWNWLNGFLGRHLGRFEQAEESLKTVLRLNDEWRDKSLATWKGEAKRCEQINAFWQMTRDRSLAELERIANAREFRGRDT